MTIVTPLLLACVAASWWRARTSPEARRLAWALSTLAALNVALLVLVPHVSGRGPFTGAKAWMMRGTMVAEVAWPGVVLVGATATLTGPLRSGLDTQMRRAAVGFYALTAAYVASSYPALRGALLLHLYRDLRLLACGGVALALLIAWRRPRGAAQWSAVALVAGMACNTAAGAWAWGNVVRDWPAAQMISVLTYTAVLALLGRDMMFARSV